MRKLVIYNLIFVALVFAVFLYAQQPVAQSGTWTVTANIGTTNGLALDSSLSTIDADLKANIVLAAGTHVIGHVIADSGSTTVVTGNVAVTKADGSDVTLGAKADAKNAATDTTAISIMSVLKEISAMAQAPASTPVTGTFFQTTQPVSCTLGNCAAQTAGLPESTNTYAATPFEADAVTTATAVKGSAGNVYGWYLYNPNASVCFLEVFNTASPTLGTTVPILSLGIPATGAANIPPGSIAVANFSTAIEIAATTASKGSSTCGTGMTVNIWYN